MAGKKENLKALFTNVRSRVIIIFTFIILATAVLIGLFKIGLFSSNSNLLASDVKTSPSIQSIPGALDPTAQYVKLQENQNMNQAKAALKSGNSAIPTIVRSQSIGSGGVPIGVKLGEGAVGFSTLSMEQNGGSQKNEWLQELANSSCSKNAIDQVINQGGDLSVVKSACSCIQIKDVGYQLNELKAVCSCPELKAAGYNAVQLKAQGYTVEKLNQCGFSACELHNAGFTAKQMLDGGYTPEELKGAGYSADDINRANGVEASQLEALKKAGCDEQALKNLRAQGVSALSIRLSNGCSLNQLKNAGYTVEQLKKAGFTAANLKKAGFTPAQLKQAGFTARDLLNAGYTPADLAAAGFTPSEISEAEAYVPPAAVAENIRTSGCSKEALVSERLAGVSAKAIKENAGCTADQLKDGGYSANDLISAGFSPNEVKALMPFDKGPTNGTGVNSAAGSNSATGVNSLQQKNAGLNQTPNQNQMGDNGFSTSVDGLDSLGKFNTNSTVPAIPGYQSSSSELTNAQAENAKRLQEIMARQNQQVENQQYQQKVQDRHSVMLSSANQYLQEWRKISTQTYTAGTEPKEAAEQSGNSNNAMVQTVVRRKNSNSPEQPVKRAMIKTGDILFAVIDTSVNSDEPGPILATIISGKFKGAKLIGSFNLPANAEKMVISFNTMSVPGAKGSTSISAYAIDANTARTALASSADTHFWYRYGNLFASSFLEGMGGAFQSADTQVTVGGTGAGDSITVQNGVNRSLLQNTVIALGDVGKAWGQVAQQNFNTPPTIEVYSGTGIGVLFTQDLTSL